MQQPEPAPRHARRKWLIILGVVILGAIVVLIEVDVHLSPLSRKWAIHALEEHYRCQVELKSFNVSLFPHIYVTGEGLVLKSRDSRNALPVALIKRFAFDESWLGLLSHPRRLKRLRLEGFVLNIPPRQENPPQTRKTRRRLPPFTLGEIIADGTVLSILPRTPGKLPHVFAISRLRLESAGRGQAMSFQATLTNPKPIGEIQSTGTFGPWNPDNPGLTPVAGSYAFRDADLSTIRGIAGILSSHGKYGGVLNRIRVQGETDTPDFAIGISGNRVHLKTQFTAVVDGTNGDTLLRPVEAQFLQSSIVARGGVLRTTGIKGRAVLLDVSAGQARIEDLLRLAVKSSKPLMTGDINLKTKFNLPPGEEDVARRLILNGGFTIQSARFTSLNVQQRLESLSRKGQGVQASDNSGSSVFNLKGRFVLKGGKMTFSSLSFSVPGASVQLHGSYGLISENLDFHGTLRLEAKLSQMTTGIKSLLLKPIDPLFARKGAGTVLPIKITGTKDQPAFGLDLGKLIK